MKKLLTTLSTLVLATTVASPVMAQSNHRHHQVLANTIMDAGVEFYINPQECFEEKSYGWYWALKNELVVCQENATNTSQVDWTEEDYDTLRHEAQHLIQDCMDGELNGSLDQVYDKPIQLAKEVIGKPDIMRIIDNYSDKSDHIKVMEIEAFAVAALNDPLEQAQDVKNFCF